MKRIETFLIIFRKATIKLKQYGFFETCKTIINIIQQGRFFASNPKKIKFYLNNIGLPSLKYSSFKQIKNNTLQYIEKMRITSKPYGRYRYCEHSSTPLLYSSLYAVMTRHLYNDLETLHDDERKEWIDYIKRHQREDGLFVDKYVENEIAEICDWWGWKHLTAHALVALSCLGEISEVRIKYIEPFYNTTYLLNWLENCKWNSSSDDSNAIHHIGAFLQYARDYQNNENASIAIEVMFHWLDNHVDKKSGLWGGVPKDQRMLDLLVQSAYHIWILYFYEKKSIPYIEKAIDSVLSNQNSLGGFGSIPNTSACQDIDSIASLVWFSYSTNYRAEDIENSLRIALPWILANGNTDGGYVFQRGIPLTYGHPLMHSAADQSAMFPTWFRSLCLSYLSLSKSNMRWYNFEPHFTDCPVLQCWKK